MKKLENAGKSHLSARVSSALNNLITPFTDSNVGELWLLQIFLDCVGYQEYFHFKQVTMNNHIACLNFMHASWSVINKYELFL